MSIQSILSKFISCRKTKAQCDYIELELEDLYIKMNRITDKEIPHEVTVVVPRAEIREKYDENQRLIEREVILNSITIVHAPRHPLAGPPSPPPEIPRALKNAIKKQ
jgi:hypothetical protein